MLTMMMFKHVYVWRLLSFPFSLSHKSVSLQRDVSVRATILPQHSQLAAVPPNAHPLSVQELNPILMIAQRKKKSECSKFLFAKTTGS